VELKRQHIREPVVFKPFFFKGGFFLLRVYSCFPNQNDIVRFVLFSLAANKFSPGNAWEVIDMPPVNGKTLGRK
jgi:hypothetical protein